MAFRHVIGHLYLRYGQTHNGTMLSTQSAGQQWLLLLLLLLLLVRPQLVVFVSCKTEVYGTSGQGLRLRVLIEGGVLFRPSCPALPALEMNECVMLTEDTERKC